jgi:prepilin-type N-terminal cleavage/methylation domain-containing protein
MRKGFTLIELLVVIAIIAVLVAMLLPTLSKAREQARIVQCMSGARQVHLAVESYCHDHKGYFPSGYGPSTYFWHQQLVELKYMPAALQTKRGCPYGPDNFIPHGGNGNYTQRPDVPIVSYGLNGILQSGHWYDIYTTFGLYKRPWKRTDPRILKYASRIGAIFCVHIPYYDGEVELHPAMQHLMAHPTNWSVLFPYTLQTPFRHKTGLPAVCLDGHAVFMPRDEIVTFPSTAWVIYNHVPTHTGILHYSHYDLIYTPH